MWISECCPYRFVSVFNNSIFEGAQHPPTFLLKLIYHWACQTSIQNVVQWVKVDSVYIKGIYTWLRAICTLAVHQKCKKLGGPGKFVEVGVISLGTTSQDGAQRQVKVEVLGVYDYADKSIRLRAVEPITDGDRNYKKRFQVRDKQLFYYNKIIRKVFLFVGYSGTVGSLGAQGQHYLYRSYRGQNNAL